MMKASYITSLFLAASLLSVLVAASFFAKPAQAAPRVVCMGTPATFAENTVRRVDSTPDVTFQFTSEEGYSTFDCSDDRHPLEGRTAQLSMLVEITVHTHNSKTGLDAKLTGIKGTFDIAINSGTDYSDRFTEKVHGDGECDESGICELVLDMKGSSESGAWKGGLIMVTDLSDPQNPEAQKAELSRLVVIGDSLG